MKIMSFCNELQFTLTLLNRAIESMRLARSRILLGRPILKYKEKIKKSTLMINEHAYGINRTALI